MLARLDSGFRRLKRRTGVSAAGYSAQVFLHYELTSYKHPSYFAAMIAEVSEDAKAVLRVVTKEAADGYTVQSRTGMDPNRLVAALRDLLRESFVQVEGDLIPENVGRAYIWVPPGRSGYARMAL